MYTLFSYSDFVHDRVRTDAYAEALRRAVTPDSVVLDIGTGMGIFALLACRFGARKVYAVEPSDAIHVAARLAAANGYADRIVLIQQLSTAVTLPERAHILVSDLRGILPLFDRHVPSIVDARRRLLVPDAVMIPQCDMLWAAVIETPEFYDRSIAQRDGEGYGLDLSASRQFLVNNWRKARVRPGQLLVEPQCWGRLDYATITSTDLAGSLTWTVAHAGVAHGLSVWFDAILAPGVGFSNAPGEPELIYGSAFFPWPEPVSVAAGDTISVSLKATLVSANYVWCWDSCVLSEGDPSRISATFAQSTFHGTPLSMKGLQTRAATHVPSLCVEGQIQRFILNSMGGKASLGQIADDLWDQFPGRFATWQDALAEVARLSQQHSRATES